jgi:flagellar protein FlbD
MIGVTCRNGEHRSVEPASIERVETVPDTVVHLVDGTKYVVDETFDELLRQIRDHRAGSVVARHRLYGGVSELPERRKAAIRLERRARARTGDAPGSPADRRDASPQTDQD